MVTRVAQFGLAMLAITWPIHAVAQPDLTPPPFEAQAFPEQPVSAAALADSYGGSLGRTSGYRSLTDTPTVAFLQQQGQTARVMMDNWWAQTGAALIDNNILARN